MASVSNKETKFEKLVRSHLFKQGLRFRKNVKTLSGKPDIVLPKFCVVIFIHGCFWHGHLNCKKATKPSSNIQFWNTKIQTNIDRDSRVKLELENRGWRVLTVWECELKNKQLFAATMELLVTEIRKSIPTHKSTPIYKAHRARHNS